MDYYLSAVPHALKRTPARHWAPATPAEEDKYYEQFGRTAIPAWAARLITSLKTHPATNARPVAVPQRRHILRHI